MIDKFKNKIRKSKFTVLITVFVVGLITITLGSALLNSVLTITGNTKLKNYKWNIHFEFVDEINATNPNSDASTDARITDATGKKENISFSTNFKDVGDKYEFTVYTWNEGDGDAMIDSVEYNMPDEYKEYIDFEAYYDDDEIDENATKTAGGVTYNIYNSKYDYDKIDIESCDPLYSKSMRKIRVIATYKKKMENLTADKDINFNFKINYVQLGDCPCEAQGTCPTTKSHLLRIRPNGGIYNNKEVETRLYVQEGKSIKIGIPTRNMYNFMGWEVIHPTTGTYTFEKNEHGEDIFTMGHEKVIIEARWQQGDYVARIMDKYYATIQDAFDDVDSKNWEDNTVWLLKDTTEYPTNRATHAFTFNLDGHTVTGTIQNNRNSNITLINGSVVAEAPLNSEEMEDLPLNKQHKAAFVNYGTLTLGKNDGNVEIENSISLIGNENGLYNAYASGSIFNFYDGFIEGDIALNDNYNSLATDHVLVIDHNNVKDCQRAYLSRAGARQVVKTITNGEKHYHNAQDAINSVEYYKTKHNYTDNDYIIYALRDFEAAYTLSVNSKRVFFDLVGFDIETGEAVTNNGYLKIYNSSEEVSNISSSVSITNKGELIIDNVNIKSSTDDNTIENENKLSILNSNVEGTSGYAVNNKAGGTINTNANTNIKSDTNYGVYNESDVLVLNNGNIYGLKNTGTVTLSNNVKLNNNYYDLRYTQALTNDGTVNMTGGTIISETEMIPVKNNGTITMTGGSISSTALTIENNGTVNANGGTISSPTTAIHKGTVNVNKGTISSTDGPTIYESTVTIDDGIIKSTNGRAIHKGSATVNGGTVSGTTAIELGTLTVTGGTITGSENGALVNDITMSGGTINATTGTGLTINNNGTITGGTVSGDLYGVKNNKKLTIGEDDGSISIEVPTIIGTSYGLVTDENADTYFYDGILKGTIDGYSGAITATPTGSVLVDGTDTINDTLYNTDYLAVFENWLRVGDTEYNSLDAASKAIDSEGTIYVIKSVNVTFAQHILDEEKNKNITFDLNGFTVRTTQPIYNQTTTTIVDSSEGQTGNLYPRKNSSVVNDKGYTLILNGGKYYSNVADVFKNKGTMTVTKAYFDVDNTTITNYNTLIIDDINIARSKDGIRQDGIDEEHLLSGSTTMNGGTIHATENGLESSRSWYQSFDVTFNGGKIISEGNGIYGSIGNKTINGGEIIAANNGINSTDSNVIVNDGKITGQKNGIYSLGPIIINNGEITGKENGIQSAYHALAVGGCYEDIIINNGTITGQTMNGIITPGNKIMVYGGTITGKIDGINNAGKTILGRDDGNISIESPRVIGLTRYGLETTGRVSFYDGILIGKEEGYFGLIEEIPVSTSIKDDTDYYIDRIQYDARYLEGYGDWLAVATSEGEKTFNSIADAFEAVEGNSGIIYVIRDAYVNFEQSIPSGKTITFDLRGHSVTMTQSLVTQGNAIMVDTEGTGLLKVINEATITNNGTLTINSGNYSSDYSYTVVNHSTLTINNGTFDKTVNNIAGNSTAYINGGKYIDSNNYGISNGGTMKITNADVTSKSGVTNNGNLTIDNIDINVTNIGINSKNNLTINDANIESNSTGLGLSDGTAIINNITLKSKEGNGIINGSLSELTINNGTVDGYLYGIKTTSRKNVTIKNGIVSGHVDAGIYNEGNVILLGGSIEGNTYGIENRGTSILGVDDGQINIDSPLVKGNLYGINILDGSITFNDGILKGTAGRYIGIITDIPSETYINEDSDEPTDDDRIFLTAYLKNEQVIAENLNQLENNQTKKYTNLQTAFSDANDGDTIRLLATAPLYYEVTNNKNITFDLYGYTISTNKKITNKGTISIVNTSNNESVIKSSSNNFIFNEGDMTLNNVKIQNKGSRSYVINNSGTLHTEVNTVIDSMSGINNTGELIASNSTFNCSNTAINNTNKLTINKGIYKGNYAIYSNTDEDILIENATINGPLYNVGNNSATINNITLNGGLQNTTSNLLVYKSTINGTISNNGVFNLNEDNLNGSIINYGTFNSNSSEIIGTSLKGIINYGTLNLLGLTNLTMGSGREDNFIGIEVNDGNVLIDNANVIVNEGNRSYGLYINNDDATVTLLNGRVTVIGARESYGAYIYRGTLVIGEKETSPTSGTQYATVSTTNPEIKSIAREYGVGVKKENGFLRFFDGIIWGSRYAKPDTTSEVEYLWEATTYADNETGYEYSILEWMGNNYSEHHVARINTTFYETVQAAVNASVTGDEIIMLRSTTENFSVPENKIIKLNLKNQTITGRLINEGTINVYNGTINNFEKSTVINKGTFIMGSDDEELSQSSIRILSEYTAVENEGTFAFYDGYIEGKVANTGTIDLIPNLTRVHLTKTAQSEKKFLQSLKEEDIISGDTDLILTIDPNGGYYEERNVIQEVYVKHHVPYTLSEPTREGCNFVGWETADESVLNGNIVTPEVRDISVKAIWQVRDDTVARIGEDYYSTLASAISHAKKGDLIELLKDTTEDVTNNKDVTIDLGGFTVTGAFINTSTLRLINGTIYNAYEDGIGLVNKKTLILGINDDNVSTSSVKIIGDKTGLKQDGRFEFYDGYVEGKVAINGIVDKVPSGFSVYIDHIDEANHQRAYLTGTPENAVAETRVGVSQFYFNLNDAVQSSALNGYEVFVIRNFEMPYKVTAPEGSNIKINLEGHTIQTANNFENNGKLLIYDNSESTKGKIVETNSIINNGELTIRDILVDDTANVVALTNNGDLILDNATIQSTDLYAVSNTGTITMDDNSVLKTTKKQALYNNNPEGLTIDHGTIWGIETAQPLTLNEGVNIDTSGCTTNIVAIMLNGQSASIVSNKVNYKSKTNILNYINGTSNNTIEFNEGSYEVPGSGELFVLPNNGTVSFNNINLDTTCRIVKDGHYSDITFNNCNMKSSVGIYMTNYNTNNIYKKNIVLNGGEYICTSNNNPTFIINGGGTGYEGILTINNGAKVISTSTINDRGAVWVEQNGHLVLNNGQIISSNIGIYASNSNPDIVINNGTVKGENFGISLTRFDNLSINKGKVIGGTYGIYVNTNSGKIDIGNNDDELVNNNPYISGGTYGLYAVDQAQGNVKFNFYNGVFRGVTAGHNVEITNQRSKTDEVVKAEELTPDQSSSYNTTQTLDVSSSPISKNAKIGNGYAKITYLGTTNDNCTNGTTTEFDYTGEEKLFTATCSGKYRLEVWGAQGGTRNESYPGGYGGYSVGDITLNQDEILYINVGGQGNYCSTGKCTGGYNGGGASGGSASTGGGATHIALKSGLLSTLSGNLDKLIIVAGGGGGTYYNNASNYGYGGSGGGSVAASGTHVGNNKHGTGGTQTSGGVQSSNTSGNGSFGQGGYYGNYAPGGGGGYYGGGSGYYAGAGGGSGYVGNTRLTNKTMYAYEAINSSTYIIDYLVDRDAFLQVGNELFNNFEDAVEAVSDNGVIYVIKDAKVKDTTTISSTKNIVIDMQGHTLSTQTITNEANLSIIDSSLNKTAKFNTVGEYSFNNKNNLSLSDITINADYKGINASEGEGNITLNNVNITSQDSAMNITAPHNVTINKATLNSTSSSYSSYTLYVSTTGATFNANNLTSGRSYFAGKQNNRLNVNIKNSNLSYNYTALEVLYTDLTLDNTIITQHTYTGTDSRALYCKSSKCTIKGDSDISGIGANTITTYYADVIIDNGTITGSSTYVANISDYSSLTMNNGTIINTSNTGSGVNVSYGTFTFNNGSIEANKYGIEEYRSTITANGGTVISNNSDGIYARVGTVTINGGTIKGAKYGIYSESNTMYIGNASDTLSTINPSIEGGTYGVFVKNVPVYFYNGRLKGTTDGINVEFKKIRTKKQVYTEEALDEDNNSYKIKYLVDLNAFLQVGNDTFDNFEDAIGAITGDSGTIKVINNAAVYDEIVFPADKDITLDLNNHTLTTTDIITANGNIIITDNSDDKGGILDSRNNQNSILAKKNITIEKVTYKSLGNAIYTTGSTAGTITINNSKIEANYGVKNLSKHRIVIDASEIKVTDRAIYIEGTSQIGADISNTKIVSDNYGLFLSGANDDIYNLTNCNIEAATSAIYFTSGTGSKTRTVNVNGGTYTAGDKCIQTYKSNGTLNLIAGTFTSTGTNAVVYNKYGIINISEDAIITSNTANGIMITDGQGTLVLNNPRIEITAKNKSGIMIGSYQNVTINNARIKTTGEESKGIQISASYTNNFDVTINNVNIDSENIGIETAGAKNNIVKIYGSNIKAGTYGIYQKGLTINYGNLESELSTTNPYTEGTLYGLYKTDGVFNFYSGRIKGYVKAYDGTIDNIRDDHEIFDDYNYNLPDEITSLRTYSTNTYSSDPVSNTPKADNGYAKITFVEDKSTGQDVEQCQSLESTEYTFGYEGHEETFNVSCPGIYKLEVWGAQAGGSVGTGSSSSGAGGYATGKIELAKNETLYINVGGKGSGENSEGGYNGGGSSGPYGNSGGGATHIATKTGLLSTLENNKDKVLIVAGGGGGGYSCGYYCSYVYHNGGSGGGYQGGKGYGENPSTQTSGYAFGQGENGDGNMWNDTAGGGGGFYGGYNYGGGSGYTGNSRLTDKVMYGYNISPKYSSESSNDAYLITATEFVLNENLNNKKYTNLQDAIDEAGNNDTLKIISDKAISTDINIILNKTVNIDLQGHQLVINKQILNKGNLTITSNSANKAKLISQLSDYIINNQGTLNINNVEFTVRCFLNNTSDGNATLNNIKSTAIDKNILNNGTLNMDGGNITSNSTAIENYNILTIDNSDISGNNYAIYDSSDDKSSIINNSNLTSTTNSIYIYNSGNYSLDKTDLTGNIKLYDGNSRLSVNEADIDAIIDSAGSLTVKKSNISKSGTTGGKIINATNTSGTTILENNTIKSGNLNANLVYCEGSLTSKNNTYIATYTDDHIVINAKGDYISIGDTITTSSYGNIVYLSNSNDKSITNMTINATGTMVGTYETNGIYANTGGNVTINDSNINIGGNTVAKGVYINNTDTNVNMDNTNINVSGSVSHEGYGVYITNGNVTIKSGTIKSFNNAISYGIYIKDGTVSTASVTLGTLDGSGLESADVSITNPHIEATGTTTGIGIRTGKRTFNYYDGIIIGSTSSRVDGEFISHSEKNFEPYVVTNATTNNQEMTLKFMAS